MGAMKICQLDIVKLAPGAYEVHFEGEQEGTSVHESISAALRHYGSEIPPEFARFVNVEYGGVRLATTPITLLATDSERLTRELVEMSAAAYHSN